MGCWGLSSPCMAPPGGLYGCAHRLLVLKYSISSSGFCLALRFYWPLTGWFPVQCDPAHPMPHVQFFIPLSQTAQHPSPSEPYHSPPRGLPHMSPAPDPTSAPQPCFFLAHPTWKAAWILFLFLSFGSTGVWIQGVILIRQMLYNLSYSTSPVLCWEFLR
jgi:hypothetical protein